MYFELDITQEDILQITDTVTKLSYHIINYLPSALVLIIAGITLKFPEKFSTKFKLLVGYITVSELASLVNSYALWLHCEREAVLGIQTAHCNDFRMSWSNTVTLKFVTCLVYTYIIYLQFTYEGGRWWSKLEATLTKSGTCTSAHEALRCLHTAHCTK